MEKTSEVGMVTLIIVTKFTLLLVCGAVILTLLPWE